ncbi:DUF6376 family protein [Radiobacillus kanasensis]|uniref:DUF6376 family protein n=1 Tax=Radiobacillus kanasensis TaxID=2844358 RepID=UPI001E30B534|nr:DUF6376 family protein [Radiobacillus kanasensis]UFU00688.1 DUF6376 family protein [Radiobacillus kanasensis]
MKRLLKHAFMGLIVVFMISGCSLFGEVNNTLDYANQAQEHINTLTQFAEEVPPMLSEALVDPQVKEDVQNKLVNIQKDIESFQNIEVPSVAESIHQELEEKNNLILNEIQKYTEQGELAIEEIQQSELFTTIRDLQSLMNQIENLGL